MSGRSCSTDSTVQRYVGAWRWSRSGFINEVRGGGNLAPVDFESTETYGTAVFSLPLITDRMVSFQPQGRDSRTYQYSDLGVVAARQSRAAVRRASAADAHQSVQLRRTFPGSRLRIQRDRARVGAALGRAVSRRDQRRRSRRGQFVAVVSVGHDRRRGPDVPGEGPIVRLCRRATKQQQLQPEQRRRLPAGQLAMEAESDDSRRTEVGVLQPAA